MALSPGGFRHHPAAAVRRADGRQGRPARAHRVRLRDPERVALLHGADDQSADGLQDGGRAARASSRWGWRSSSCPSRRSRTPGVPLAEVQPGQRHHEPLAQHGRRHRDRVRDDAHRAARAGPPGELERRTRRGTTRRSSAPPGDRYARLRAQRATSSQSTRRARRRRRCTGSSCSRRRSSRTSTPSFYLGVATALMVPLVWIAKRPQAGAAPVGGH